MSLPVTRESIRAAHARIANHIRRTPVFDLPSGAFGASGPLSLKLELFQHAGSFKPRGAFNTLTSVTVPPAGVAAASGGNHGAAVAFAARALGLKARIFVPEISSPAKIAKIREFGAEVVVEGARYNDALALCEAYQAASGAYGVHAFDAWPTIEGQGTVALEWQEQAGGLDTVLVAAGGGGLISGMAIWFGRQVKVVASSRRARGRSMRRWRPAGRSMSASRASRRIRWARATSAPRSMRPAPPMSIMSRSSMTRRSARR